jgi:hypothetical protein
MKFIKTFVNFLTEKKEEKDFEDKIKGHGYFKGISTSTARKKVDQMKDQAAKPDNDPSAYKELPGDTKGKKLLKPSKHTKNYQDIYADDEKDTKNESIINWELYQKLKENDLKIEKEIKDFSILPFMINEDDAGGDRSPIDNDAIETGLKKKSEETGVPLPLLRIVMRRGMAAWKSGHRPGAGQEQWGYARVNSFLTQAPGTWGRPIKDPQKNGPKGAYGADADVAQEVIKGGHDKNLKKG